MWLGVNTDTAGKLGSELKVLVLVRLGIVTCRQVNLISCDWLNAFGLPPLRHYHTLATNRHFHPRPPKFLSTLHLTNLLTMSTAELAASYAAIILADDGVDITVSLPWQNRTNLENY